MLGLTVGNERKEKEEADKGEKIKLFRITHDQPKENIVEDLFK